jgi:putative membrane protein
MRRTTDALANERTFLAYARTALAFIAFGFVIARFSLFEREVEVVAHINTTAPHLSTLFGTLMALAGVACGIYGALRYVLSARANRNDQEAAMPDQAATIGAAVIALIGVIVMWALFNYR